MKPVLALDLGGTNLRAAVARGPVTPDDLPQVIHQGAAPGNLDGFREIVSTLVAEVRPAAIGLAVPGLVGSDRCIWVPNLPWLDDTPLDDLAPGLPVRAANDAQFALLAEVAAGAAQAEQTLILLAIGTGIGSALMAEGRILQGGATSFGWACADTDAAGDPSHGWLERQAAGRALDRAADRLGLSDGAALVAAARGDHPGAMAEIGRAGAALGTALSGAVALTGARRIVVSGGVAAALDLLRPSLMSRLVAHLPPHLRGVTLDRARFGRGASLAGAAIAAQGHPCWRVAA